MLRRSTCALALVLAGCPAEPEEAVSTDGAESGTVGTSAAATSGSATATTSGTPTTSGLAGSSSGSSGSSTGDGSSGSGGPTSSSSGASAAECTWFDEPTGGRSWGRCMPALAWAPAEAHCVAEGGHLVSIGGAPDGVFAINVLGAVPEAWIGLNDRDREGTLVWSDGEPYVYMNWDDGQPDNADDRCIAIGGTRRWFDYDCDEARPFVCTRPR